MGVEIAGWGKGGKSDIVASDLTKFVIRSRCIEKWQEHYPGTYKKTIKSIYKNGLNEGILCAGDDDGVAVCLGDSGGPMIHQDESGIKTVIGVVSRGIIGCPEQPLVPSFYTNIIQYLEWIYINTGLPRETPTKVTSPDPCNPGPCGTNAICNKVNHIAICSCPDGYNGDPKQECQPDKTGLPRVTLSHLTSNPKNKETSVVQPVYTNLNLWNAARDGNLAEVEVILATGIDPNWNNPNSNGYTSLHIASENNHPSIMNLLLRNGANKDQKDIHGSTSVYHASNHGHIDAVSLLIKHGANITIPQKGGWTPLMQATGKGYFDIVQTLTEDDRNVNLANELGETALHEAAQYNRAEIARSLFDKGADIMKTNNKKETPIDKARLHGYYELEDILKELAGIKVIPVFRPEISYQIPIQINKGQALWNAARDGDMALVKSALANGNNPNWKNHFNHGRTPLHIAALNNHPWVISALIDAGAIKDTKDNNGWTPIFVASGRGSKDAVQRLISHDANVDIALNNGYTPLMQATGKGYIAIVKALIQASDNVNKLDEYGGTAFTEAAYYNRRNIAELLLGYGANPKRPKDSGQTPALIARERGFSDLANYIDSLRSNAG